MAKAIYNKGMFDDSPDYVVPQHQYAASDWFSKPLSDRQDILKYGSVQKAQERTALPQNLASMADPYAAERNQLVRDPSAALSKSPFFQFMQERAMNAVAGKNRAAGLRNSGAGQLALQDTATKSAAQFYFPYLQSLGSPTAGANAYFEGLKFNNPSSFSGSASGYGRSPRTSLSNMGAQAPSALPIGSQVPGWSASSAGTPYTDAQWQGAMGYAQPQPAMTAGTGYVQANPWDWEG